MIIASYKIDQKCSTILKDITKDGKIVPWDVYDRKLQSLNLNQFPKGEMPPTQDPKFKKTVSKLVDLLKKNSSYNEYYSVLSFLKYHPDVNEILLSYAVVGANLERDDISHIIVDPFKVSRIHTCRHL